MVDAAIRWAVYTSTANRDRVSVGHIIPSQLPETPKNVEEFYGHILSGDCPCNPKLRDESPITFIHNLLASTDKVQLAVFHIDALMRLAGLDNSESATEAFAEILGRASAGALKECKRSRKNEGLFLDCRWDIAETILKGE